MAPSAIHAGRKSISGRTKKTRLVLRYIVLPSTGTEQLKDREYLGTVSAIHLNADYAAVMFEGKVQLHLVRSQYRSKPDLVLIMLYRETRTDTLKNGK